MTGGQHSTTTPTGAITSTTRASNLERPLDICSTVAANGASYVYRGTSFDKDLPERLAEAIHESLKTRPASKQTGRYKNPGVTTELRTDQ